MPASSQDDEPSLDAAPLGEPLVDVEDLGPTAGEPRLPFKWLLGACLILTAFNIRIIFSSFSTVLPEIMQANGLAAWEASVLTTVPVVCMGVFSFSAAGLAQRHGAERVIFACMAILTLGTGLRALGATPMLLLASILAGGSIAMINVLLPGLVKRDFPRHTALMTGLYTTALCGGAALAAALTVPMEKTLGGAWPAALGLWAVPALIAVLLWIPQVMATHADHRRGGFVVRGLLRDRLAWQVTLFMGLQSSMAYIVYGWLAPLLRERGLDSVSAGLALSVSVLFQMLGSLTMPTIAMRLRDQKLITVALFVLGGVSFIGCVLLPLWTAWVWVALLGITQGGILALAMMIIILRSPDVHVAAKLSGMAQGFGYVIAAFGPLLAGIIHNLTGSFNGTVGFFLALTVGASLCVWAAGARAHVGVRSEPAETKRRA